MDRSTGTPETTRKRCGEQMRILHRLQLKAERDGQSEHAADLSKLIMQWQTKLEKFEASLQAFESDLGADLATGREAVAAFNRAKAMSREERLAAYLRSVADYLRDPSASHNEAGSVVADRLQAYLDGERTAAIVETVAGSFTEEQRRMLEAIRGAIWK